MMTDAGPGALGRGDRRGQVVAAGAPARQTQGWALPSRGDGGAGGGRPMERTGERRPHWGRRALVLALIGGLVGWIVVCVWG